MLTRVFAALIAASLTTPAFAQDLTVSDAWIRALPGVADSGYFTLKNTGATARTLTGASSPACGSLMLHKTTIMKGMTMMADVKSVAIPAGGQIAFAPDGYHLMCGNPSAAIKPGATVTVTLAFANGGKLAAPFAVKNAKGE